MGVLSYFKLFSSVSVAGNFFIFNAIVLTLNPGPMFP